MAETGGATLRAAAAKIDVTPPRPAYIAGYDSNRRSTGAHDPISARCLILESGRTRLAFVTCDVIGLRRTDILKIRAQVRAIEPAHLFISATHTHSGPDTLGQWGPAMTVSGVDKEWLASTCERIVKLVDEAAERLQPAMLRFASTKEVGRVSKNIRKKEILDTELGVMQAVDARDGKPIGTFVNYACHPEVLRTTHELSADFVHWVYERVEAKAGGICLFANGALGGMVTADFDDNVEPKGKNWKAAEEIGVRLGNRVIEIMAKAEPSPDVTIRTQQRVFQVPLENQQFKSLIKLKVFPNDLLPGGNIETEVNRIRIGDAEFITMPGETLPNIGLMLKGLMHGKPKFLLGLTSDELGYILTKEDFGTPLYDYESRVSVGKEMGERMVQSIRVLLDEK